MKLLRWLTGQPYLLLTLTTALWAGNVIAGKFAVGHISPFLLTMSRWGAAFCILIVFAWPRLRADWPVIRRHWPFLAMLGAVGFMAFNNLFYLAAHYTSAINVAILQAAMPLFVFMLNFVLFRMRSTGLQLVGFVLTIAGVVLTATQGDVARLSDQQINFGDILVLFSALSYALYSVMVVRKPAMHWLSTITVLAFFALLASIPFTAWEASQGRLEWPDPQGWLVVLYTTLFPSILSQVMWIRGLEMIGSNRGGIFMNLVPIFAAGMAVVLLGEVFHLYHAVAMVLVVAGVWLSQRKPRTAQASGGG